jgi:hypothetical protein
MRVKEENEWTVVVVVDDRRRADSEERWEWEYKSDECGHGEMESLGNLSQK